MTPSRKHNPSRKQLRAVVNEVGPDDGVDPRDDAKARARQHRELKRPSVKAPGARPGAGTGRVREPGRKASQLGRQVAETLDAVLAGDSGDEVLRDLRVVSVVPAPDASRLLVTVSPLPGSPAALLGPVEVLARLDHAAGWLRTEAAAAVTRKRAPALSFQLAPPGDD